MSVFEKTNNEDTNKGRIVRKLFRVLRKRQSLDSRDCQPTTPAVLSSTDIGVAVRQPPPVSKKLEYDVLVNHSDCAQDVLDWAEIAKVEPELLAACFDDYLYRVNKGAWETMSYIVEPNHRPIEVVRLYQTLNQHMLLLSDLLRDQPASVIDASPLDGNIPAGDAAVKSRGGALTEEEIMEALWRICSYCTVSINGLTMGRCIADQTRWLRGCRAPRVSWEVIWDKAARWRLNPDHGVFAQGNSGYNDEQRQHNNENMARVWQLLSDRWARATVEGKEESTGGAEQALMFLLSRPTGLIDLVGIIAKLEPQYYRLSFRQAFTYSRIAS